MANHGYEFIDPDLHVFEPSDLWTRYIAPGFRDQAPVGSDAFVGDSPWDVNWAAISSMARCSRRGPTSTA